MSLSSLNLKAYILVVFSKSKDENHSITLLLFFMKEETSRISKIEGRWRLEEPRLYPSLLLTEAMFKKLTKNIYLGLQYFALLSFRQKNTFLY